MTILKPVTFATFPPFLMVPSEFQRLYASASQGGYYIFIWNLRIYPPFTQWGLGLFSGSGVSAARIPVAPGFVSSHYLALLGASSV
jgi:hypothetical protein